MKKKIRYCVISFSLDSFYPQFCFKNLIKFAKPRTFDFLKRLLENNVSTLYILLSNFEFLCLVYSGYCVAPRKAFHFKLQNNV